MKNPLLKFFIIYIWTIGISLLTASAQAETIRLKSGKIIEGKIIEQTTDSIRIDTGIGVLITYYLDEIDTFESKATSIKPETTPIKPEAATTTDLGSTVPVASPPSIPKPQTPAPALQKKQQPLQKHGEEFDLYRRASAAPQETSPTININKDEYLKTQLIRANAILKERALNIIVSTKEQVTNKWRNLKDTYPIVKITAQSPAGWPIGIVFWAGIYSLICFPLMMIARKLNSNSLMAWIPALQIFLLIDLAHQSFIWILFLLFPLVNIFAFIFLWMHVARRLGQSHRLGYLMIIPGINILTLWYIALRSKDSPEPSETNEIETGISFE